MGCLGFAGVLLVSHFYSYELSASIISEVPVYVFSCCSAWILSKSLAMGLERIPPLSKGLVWIGRHTMVIMCLHVLCFKLVSLLYIETHGLPWVYLAAWHAILDTNELWKLLYVIVGVTGPLLLYKIWTMISFKTFIHPVSLYAAVGISATGVEWMVFYFLNQILNLHYVPSIVVATVFSGFANWVVGRILMFRGASSPLKDIGKIYLTSAVGMVYNLVLMWFMINKIGFHQMAAKVVATVVVFAWNYMIVTKLIYRGRLKTWITEQR
jgi:putative flippase GtrA